jgi:hypothetical protein
MARLATAAAALSVALVWSTQVAPSASAKPGTFGQDTAGAALSALAPGTILGTRTLSYHVVGIPTPIVAVQLRYRTTNAAGKPVANLTSVLLPPGGVDPTRAVAYQSFYDSLNPADSPSRAIEGDVTFGGLMNVAEGPNLASLLARGYTVIVADTEGQAADFAAGPEYGMNTLDSIRAATHSPATGLDPRTRIGLIGYSGGAIGTGWAAALAPRYAPDINARLVGAAEAGLLVNPGRNLSYISGSFGWAGVGAMAIIGVGRSYGIDFTPYLNDYGLRLVSAMRDASIADVLFRYQGLTWQQMAKPRYADPASVAPFMAAVREVDLGLAPTPTIPMFIGQGANGELEGTDGDKAGIGPGDGVMIAGDVRALARQYCATGDPNVDYTQYDALSHIPTGLVWTPAAVSWLDDRFAGLRPPSTCGEIAPGNSLAPHP